MKKNVPIAKRDAHARSHIFRLEICRSLLNKSLKRKAGPEVASASAYKTTKPGTHNLLRLPGRKRACYQYAQEKKKTGARRTPETVFEYASCNMRLCKGHCFATFHKFKMQVHKQTENIV